MRLASARFEKYRCLRDVTVEFDEATVLVGANGTGKSSVLRGLNWLFNGGPLDEDDIWRHEADAIVRVSITVSDFTTADRDALRGYALGETATFTRSWSGAEGEKLTGHAFTFPGFNAIRAAEGAVARRTAYHQLVEEHPELGLQRVANQDELTSAMAVFEQDHPQLLEPSDADATHLFGFVGGAKLNGRFAYVFVPATGEAQAQLTGARGSLLSRLIERLPSESSAVADELDELKVETQQRADELIRGQHEHSLNDLGTRMTAAIREFVPAAEVQVTVHAPEIRVTEPTFNIHVADDGVSTDIAHQGHGFQRALIMATLNELARAEDEGDVPAVFLAIEEPELYQHPLQARHFATVLAQLPRGGEGAFQVAYATHSQFFIDPERYERLRRFSRRLNDGERTVTVATTPRVAGRLEGLVDPQAIPARIRLTLDRQIAEAVFADVALIVEGKTDAGLISGIGDRGGGLESKGVAVVNVDGKSKVPLAAAILGELGIPTYIVFDADRGKEARLRERAGNDEVQLARITGEIANTAQWNRRLLVFAGAVEEDWPDSRIAATFAVFADTIESEWPEAVAEAGRLANEAGDDPKRAVWYREAARSVGGDPPELLTRLLESVERLR